ncbi:MAG: hypothetical protein LWY06_10085, partial [Firmicutes bacterium]|nr:hypothetical protein [Bacillota bacterium]
DDAMVFSGSKTEEDQMFLSLADSYFLIIYDADEQSSEQLVLMCNKQYGDIKDIDKKKWLVEDFVLSGNDAFAAFSGKNKALYIWADPTTQKGTLEDYIKPLIREHPAIQQAETFIDETCNWDPTRVSESAKRMKAIITAIGQKEKPGSSMNVIIKQTKIIKPDELKNDELVKKFISFIASFIGIEAAQ